MKLSDYVIQRVAEEVKHIFMLVGGGSMHLVDSVGRCRGLEYVCNLHEQAVAIAADAYGQYTNNLGVALVTTGPGGTNTLTGVAAAWLDSTPCLFISGQVKRADLVGNSNLRQMGFQELNIVEIMKPITKYAVTVTEPTSIGHHLERAIYLAKSDRPGPVWVDIPLDVQAAKVNELEMEGFESHKRTPPPELLEQRVSQAIQLLNQADRPVILVGNGVRLAHGIDDFLELVELLQMPVLTTWKSLDFLSEDHSLYMGRPGAIGQRGANFAQQNSDWILTLGARLDLGQTGYNHRSFARIAKKIVVDVDSAEIQKMDMAIDVPVRADAKEFIQEFLRQKDSVISRERAAWWGRCRDWRARYPVILPEYWEAKTGVNNYVLIDVLSNEMSSRDLLIPGSSGACGEVVMQAFRVKQGMRIFNGTGLGAMGFGIPASIGGCVASGRRTICIDGDGGFQLNIQELETVKRLNLPIKFFVLNNGGYGSIQATQRRYFNSRYVGSNPKSGLTLPNTLRVAEAYGLPTVQINGHYDIREQVRRVLDMKGPAVCEVVSSPNQVTAPRLSSRQRADGSMASMPMEDLWPFLERDEFRANMEVR